MTVTDNTVNIRNTLNNHTHTVFFFFFLCRLVADGYLCPPPSSPYINPLPLLMTHLLTAGVTDVIKHRKCRPLRWDVQDVNLLTQLDAISGNMNVICFHLILPRFTILHPSVKDGSSSSIVQGLQSSPVPDININCPNICHLQLFLYNLILFRLVCLLTTLMTKPRIDLEEYQFKNLKLNLLAVFKSFLFSSVHK